MRNRERAKSLCDDITQRTRHDMLLDILEILTQNEDGMKVTNIGHKCELNYLTSRDIVGKLLTDELVKRDSHGYYLITKLGEKYLKMGKMPKTAVATIVDIAREAAFCENSTKRHELLLKMRSIFEGAEE